jgi:hypothetical protein
MAFKMFSYDEGRMLLAGGSLAKDGKSIAVYTGSLR